MAAEGELKWVLHNTIPPHWADRHERRPEGRRKEATEAAPDWAMVHILALVLQHDEQAVLSAVGMALKSSVQTKTHEHWYLTSDAGSACEFLLLQHS